jgi:hypothetical protein
MSRRVVILAVIAATLVGLATWAVVWFLGQTEESPAGTPGAANRTDAPAARRISATLYYVSADGLRLEPAQRDVLFGATTAQQARHVIEAQLEPAPTGLTNAMPPGVTVSNVFVADNGDAYVDFSVELRQQHPGGSLNEIFTVYTIVHALTTNLPAIKAVQILVGGHEVDTLAGHVDLRRPLPRAQQWLEPPPAKAPAQPGAAR